jgi:phage gpG-like protein
MSEGFEGIGRLIHRVGEIATDVTHVERALNAAGEYMIGSVKQTFAAQGRPKKWTPLAPSTLRSRRHGKGRGGSKILIDTAKMMNAVSKQVSTAGVAVGLNADQARRQHSGYPGGPGRGHSHTPARPFLVIQPEDVVKIGSIFERHIARKI